MPSTTSALSDPYPDTTDFQIQTPMHISRITVRNFRLLKEFSIDLEETMSLVVGKNNTGKTSLLKLLDTMINGNELSYNDFNISYSQQVFEMVSSAETVDEDHYTEDGISLRLYIEYGDQDDLDCLGKILMDLDVNNHTAIIGFDYYLPYVGYLSLRQAYSERLAKKSELLDKSEEPKLTEIKRNELNYILSKKLGTYYKLTKKSIEYDAASKSIIESSYIDLKKRNDFRLDELISFRYIDARRNVTNAQKDATLSGQTSALFEKMNDDAVNKSIMDFQESLISTDEELSHHYEKIFEEIVDNVRLMGGIKKDETQIKIISTLQQRELIKGNTTVVYAQDISELPEHYNGLGYMNLISMIFQIEIIRREFLSTQRRRISDINMLIIEEPEAHTHPQMQYIFIKNIKELLSKPLSRDGMTRCIQSVISTHSSHIVSESNFDTIKYMVRVAGNKVEARNMKDLKNEYNNDEKQYYTFLKHYLTLSRSELFFADKAIFIEGDTERILLPTMMKKLDQEEPLTDNEIPLTQQNISIIEVGAYSHVFGKFINFIGLKKVLVFTDIDICQTGGKGHPTKSRYDKTANQVTSNASIKSYYGKSDIKTLIGYTEDDKIFSWDDANKTWKKNPTGNMRVYYQVEEDGYQPRSFEDGFFHINKEFIKTNKDNLTGLDPAKVNKFLGHGDGANDAYVLAEDGIESKATFAVEIIYFSKHDGNKDFTGWNIPKYIKDGLLWIRK